MKSPRSQLSRRNFLLAVGAGSASAAAALVANKNTESGAQPAQKEGAAGNATGYRLTEHIRNYYRTAKV